MTNVLLVDDHQLFRAGIKRILQETKKFKVIAEVASGEEAIKWCRQYSADIILMDINMPGMGGLEALRRLLGYNAKLKIVGLSSHRDPIIAKQMMQRGALGYFNKDVSPTEFIAGMQTIVRGTPYIMQEIITRISATQHPTYSNHPIDLLSKRELQIMLMILSGNKTNHIAESLHLSPKTVNSYRYRIFNKLKVKNDIELIHLALSYQLISDEMLIKSETGNRNIF